MTTFSIHTVASVAAAAIAMVGHAVCSSASAQSTRQVSIGLSSTSLVAAAPRIAQALGLFETHGLEPKFTVMQSANAATTAVIARSLDIALAGPGEIISAQSRGQKVVLLLPIYSGLGGTLLLSKTVVDKLGVKPAAPIMERLKALEGVSIGTASPTSPYTVAVKGAALKAGATPKFVYVSVPAMSATLEAGAIEGYIASAPLWFAPVLKQTGVAWISGPKGEFPRENTPSITLGLASLREYAEANPEIVRKLGAIFADLRTAIESRPADVKTAITKVFPEFTGGPLDIAFASEAPAWRVRTLTPADMAHEISFVKSTGVQLPGMDNLDPASLIMNRK